MITIYKHTCVVNNKSYIGQTCNLLRRTKQHVNGHSRCTAFSKAIQKYGWNSFTTTILAETIDRELSNVLETLFISHYHTLCPSGYNLHPGGMSSNALPETKLKLSLAKRGERNPNFGSTNHHKLGYITSEETKQKISTSLKTRNAESGPRAYKPRNKCKIRVGYVHSALAKEKMKAAKIGKNHSVESKAKMSHSKKGKNWIIDPITGKRRMVDMNTLNNS